MVHVYFMPGMAASSKIFENIKLPENEYTMHLLEWLPPEKKETLESYCHRVNKLIVHENPVLIGVSFGGIVVQEISKFSKVKKVIIISSVKTCRELPRRMKIAKFTFLYKLFPSSIINHFNALQKIAITEFLKQRIKLYKRYMKVPNKYYLDWAIEKVICWKQNEVLNSVVHIHGDKDEIFPFKHIKNAVAVPNGTHIMVVNRYKWFNENLPRIISEAENKN